MQHHQLFELAIATAFCGKNVLGTLRDELRRRKPSDEEELRERCLDSLRDDLSLDFPRRFRKTDLETVFNVVWPAPMFHNTHSLVMAHEFDRLMKRDGLTVQHQPERVRDYARFAATFDPTCLVAWHIASEIHNGAIHNCAYLCDMVQAQQPFFTAPPQDGEHYTDGHVHINGLHFDGVILMNQLWSKLGSLSKGSSEVATLSALAHTLLFSPRVQIGNQHGEYTGNSGDIKLRKIISPLLAEKVASDGEKLAWSWVALNEPTSDEINWHWLRHQIGVAVEADDLASAWLWLHVFLWWQSQHTKATPTLRICIHYLQGSLMQIRKKLIMDGVGLADFKDISNDTLRKSGGKSNGLANARILLQGREDCAEIKVGPDFFSPAKIRLFLDSLCRARDITPDAINLKLNAQQLEQHHRQANQWHACVHFARKREHNSISGRITLWQQADKLLQAISSSTTWRPSDLLAHPSSDAGFAPANWIRGFDVVGDENEARIELYAPMLRWLRTDDSRDKRDELNALQSPAGPVKRKYLSVHAGEDYAHPLSGMRHVDETVLFCQMGAGDRLGHALALGITPRLWCERQGDILLSASEHLDNLVWARYYANLMRHTSAKKKAQAALPLIAQRIEAIASHVHWATGNPGEQKRPDILYKAWSYRDNCPFQVEAYKSSLLSDRKIKIGAPNYIELMEGVLNSGEGPKSMSAEQVYFKRSSATLDETKKETTVMLRQRSHEKDTAHFDDKLKLLVDYDSDEELEFMYALQDYLLEKYRKKKLIIEVNPTSNLFISRLNDYGEHPIFRWSPPNAAMLSPGQKYNKYSLRKGAMAVTVNTDDPGIMPTTLRTEFNLLRDAAITLKETPKSVADWLSQIRTLGNQEFKEKHLSVWTTFAA